MSAATLAAASFALPRELEAHAPPEARGVSRDGVRLMVSCAGDGAVMHARFRALARFLSPGDVLVVNRSATMPAAIRGVRLARAATREPIVLHVSTRLAAAAWAVELRRLGDAGTSPLLDAAPGDRVALPAGVRATLLAPYRAASGTQPGSTRLWVAALSARDVVSYLYRHGRPVRYGYVPHPWPLSAYQTVFASEPGSAEMPSAGRPFTRRVLRSLARRGVRLAPVVLHTGVSSPDLGEPPYPERFHVPRASAGLVNRSREMGGRVVAVGTTSLRALETVAAPDGRVRAGRGWTELVITPERGVFAADALLTGWHAPGASHLQILEALAGEEHVMRAHEAALREGYLWHEFGDVHLLFAAAAGRSGRTLPA